MITNAKTSSLVKRESISAFRLAKVLVVAAGTILFVYAWVTGSVGATVPVAEPGPEPPLGIQDKDYSRFIHGNQYHSRLPCLLCHRRDDNSARVGFPGKSGHMPCAGCHALQFTDQSSPICTICHTNPQNGAMKRFPRLRSFGARFNHSKHMRTNCATCHKPAQRGVARTIPAGLSAHTTCFQCHSSNSSNTMASCNLCHQPGRLVRTSQSARAFRIGFSHARHSGRSLSCATCHTVRAGTARGRQVTNPVTAMHFATSKAQSCATCHNGQRSFGTDDFANCKRCHAGNSFRF
jgi:c(7)-type cytochrome triheme protein